MQSIEYPQRWGHLLCVNIYCRKTTALAHRLVTTFISYRACRYGRQLARHRPVLLKIAPTYAGMLITKIRVLLKRQHKVESDWGRRTNVYARALRIAAGVDQLCQAIAITTIEE